MGVDGYESMSGELQWFDNETADIISRNDQLWVKVDGPVGEDKGLFEAYKYYKESGQLQESATSNGTISGGNFVSQTESWLDSPGKNTGSSIVKAGAGILYGVLNDPKILVTGKSIGGTPSQKMDAFVSTAPGLVLAGVTPKVGRAVKTVGRGLPKNQYNAFLKQTKMQSGPNASRAYRLNKERQFFNRLENQSGGAESATNNTSTIAKKVKDDEEN